MFDDCIENYLEFKDETPEALIHQHIDDMTKKYGDYKKVLVNKKRGKELNKVILKT